MHGVATVFGDAVPMSIHALQVLIVRACPIKRLFCSRFFRFQSYPPIGRTFAQFNIIE